MKKEISLVLLAIASPHLLYGLPTDPVPVLDEAAERKLMESPKICEQHPSNVTVSSSKEKYMGIGGVDTNRDCPGMELFWISLDRFSAACFRGPTKKVVRLGGGFTPTQATFSPDCKHFWATAGRGIEIFNLQGKALENFEGVFPVWTADSKALLFQSSAPKHSLALKRFTLGGTAKEIARVQDVAGCVMPAEGIEWRPVVVHDETAEWAYPTNEKAPAGSVEGKPAKRVTVNLKTGKMTDPKWESSYCEESER